MDSIFIGYDPRETEAFSVCRHTIRKHNCGLPIHPLDLSELRRSGYYWRVHEQHDGQMFDVISGAPMSTEFAISRFLTPILAKKTALGNGLHGWAVFMDCDMLVRDDIGWLFKELKAYPDKALMCVQHNYQPANTVKMDGQEQTRYARKNWSSVMAFNLDHPANDKLTVELINTVPGRDLHRFCWLEDSEIGALGPEWNYLVGITKDVEDPSIVHFTNGGPWFGGEYIGVEYGDEWLAARREWLAESTVVRGRPSTIEAIKPNGGEHAAYLR